MYNLSESIMQCFPHLLQIVTFHRTMCRDKECVAHSPKLSTEDFGTVLLQQVYRSEITVFVDVRIFYIKAPHSPCVT